MEDESSPPPDFVPTKPKKPFLKRGTGEARIFSGPPTKRERRLKVRTRTRVHSSPARVTQTFAVISTHSTGTPLKLAYGPGIERDPTKKPAPVPASPSKTDPNARRGALQPPSPSRPLSQDARRPTPPSQAQRLPPRSPRNAPVASPPQGPPERAVPRSARAAASASHRPSAAPAAAAVHESTELRSDVAFVSIGQAPSDRAPEEYDPTTGARRSPSAAAMQWRARRAEEEIELEEFELLERQLRSELGGSTVLRASHIRPPAPLLVEEPAASTPTQGGGGLSPRPDSKLAQLKYHRAQSRQQQRGGHATGEAPSPTDPFPPAPTLGDDREPLRGRGRPPSASGPARGPAPSAAPAAPTTTTTRPSLRDRSASRERLRSISRERRSQRLPSHEADTPSAPARASADGPSFPTSLRDPNVHAALGRSYAEIMAEKRRALADALASGARPPPSAVRTSQPGPRGSGQGMELTFSGGGSGMRDLRAAVEGVEDNAAAPGDRSPTTYDRPHADDEEEEYDEAQGGYGYGSFRLRQAVPAQEEATDEGAGRGRYAGGFASQSLAAATDFDWIVAQHAAAGGDDADDGGHGRYHPQIAEGAEDNDEADERAGDGEGPGPLDQSAASYGDRSAWDDADSISRLSMFTATGPSRIPQAGAARAMRDRQSHQQQQQQQRASGSLDDPTEVPPATNQLVKELFGKQHAAAAAAAAKRSPNAVAQAAAHEVAFTEAEVLLLRELEGEVRRAQEERVHVERVKQEVERERQKLALARSEIEREAEARRREMDAAREEADRKLKRDRRVLEKQAKALLQLPTKKERSEVEALQAAFEDERKEWRGREARYKLTVERLRKQIAVRGVLCVCMHSLLACVFVNSKRSDHELNLITAHR